MKMTITRALSELKVLRSRYTNSLLELKPIAVKHGSKLRAPYSSYKADDFEAQALRSLQSTEALQARLLEIKTKIDISNSKTIIEICGRKMTIQEALVMKSMIDLKEQLLENLKSYQYNARREYEKALDENQKRVDKMVSETTASMGNSPAKPDPDTEKKALESVESLYKVEFVDPGKLGDRIENLKKEIEDFKSNIDYALSESNSTTFIDIAD